MAPVSGQIAVAGASTCRLQLAVLPNTPGSSGPTDGGQVGRCRCRTASASDLAVGNGITFVQVAVGRQVPARFARTPVLVLGRQQLWSTPLAQHLQPPDASRGSGRVLDSGGLRTEPLLCSLATRPRCPAGVTTGSGQLGATPTPAAGNRWLCPVAPGKAWRLAVYQTCAIKQDGTLWC